MRARRAKLTTGGKILVFILTAALVAAGVFFGVSKGVIKNDFKPEYDSDGNVMNVTKKSADTINVSLDEWIG